MVKTMLKPIKKNQIALQKDEEIGIGKHLVEMKELPPQPDVISAPIENKNDKESVEKEVANDSILDNEEETKSPFSAKDIILGVVNLISVILLIIILVNFPKRAEEFKKLKIEDLRNESNIEIEFTGVEQSAKKGVELQNFFLDEAGIINFVNEVEKFKAEGSAISKVSFASQTAVKDKTGNFGIPVVIELNGSWAAIEVDLQKIDKLSFLVRPIKIEIGRSKEDPNIIEFKYGLFLYVNDELGKDR